MVQRSTNTQPGSVEPSAGGVPTIVSSRSAVLFRPPRGMQRSNPTVYGWVGLERTVSVRPSSTSEPAYNTPIRSHIVRITPKLWLMNNTEVPVSLRRVRTRSSTSASTVASRPVVGSSITNRRGFDARAMAITTRWAMPPESWCGKRPITRVGSAICTFFSASSVSCIDSDLDLPRSWNTSAT